MTAPSPMWRQVYDAAERTVTPRMESLVRTPGFAIGAALVRRAQTVAGASARDVTARAWHLVNLPAGSDVSRLRSQIGALDREVRRLTVQLELERDRTSGGSREEEQHADGAHSEGGPRPRPPRRRAQRPSGA